MSTLIETPLHIDLAERGLLAITNRSHPVHREMTF